MSGTNTSDVSSWTVITTHQLRDQGIGKILWQKVSKVRTSESVMEGVVVFPAAKTAFLVLELTSAVVKELCSQTVGKAQPSTLERIDSMLRVHAQCYVILVADLFTGMEFQALTHLQNRYLTSDTVDFLLAHNADECVTAMLMVSLPQAPPMSYTAHQKFCELMTQMIHQGMPKQQHLERTEEYKQC